MREKSLRDYYEVLGLENRASIESVVKRYHSKMKKERDADKKKDIWYAFHIICHKRQTELYKYLFYQFLKSYQSMTYEELFEIINELQGNRRK